MLYNMSILDITLITLICLFIIIISKKLQFLNNELSGMLELNHIDLKAFNELMVKLNDFNLRLTDIAENFNAYRNYDLSINYDSVLDLDVIHEINNAFKANLEVYTNMFDRDFTASIGQNATTLVKE